MERIIANTYKVGGFVRDSLLGIEPQDTDYVVVGITVEEIIAAGFKQVGAGFPVFLHPQTGEEYALARHEWSTGGAHTDFMFYFGADVTLEEDLMRRDLTVNAMAFDHSGQLIDPYNGRTDLEQRVLRHVSESFADDPLRVLRVARFMARYAHMGFTVASETIELMRKMCRDGLLKALPKERIWKEVSRALMEQSPTMFFETLRECDGLDYWFPELKALIGVPQPLAHHPEGCTFKHVMLTLEQAVINDLPVDGRWALVCHDLGKALSPTDELPHHRGHEKSGVPLVRTLCNRVGAPNDASKLARLICEHHLRIHRALELSPKKLIKVIQSFDGLRKPDLFHVALKTGKCDATGRTGFEERAYPQEAYLLKALEALKSIDEKEIVQQYIDNPKLIPEKIHHQRVRVMKHYHFLTHREGH